MSTIATNKQRANDLKLLAIITTIVILGGFFIAGSILFLSRGGKTGPCGRVNAGSLTDLVPRAATAPSYVAVSGGCSYWLALRNGKLVAIRPTITSRNCTVDWKPANDHFTCDGTQVTFAQLDYYKTAVGTGAFKGSWIVDFGDERTAPTSAATAS
jgi:hypothetical protein